MKKVNTEELREIFNKNMPNILDGEATIELTETEEGFKLELADIFFDFFKAGYNLGVEQDD